LNVAIKITKKRKRKEDITIAWRIQYILL